METRTDSKELLELCNKHKIEYRIVGGYALGPDADAARRMVRPPPLSTCGPACCPQDRLGRRAASV
jgi:hypothetical protein